MSAVKRLLLVVVVYVRVVVIVLVVVIGPLVMGVVNVPAMKRF